MKSANIDLVARRYRAFVTGDSQTIAAALAPEIRWHSSGFDATSGTFVGVDAVLQHLHGEDHMAEFLLEVIDMLASEERVAVVARSSGRRGTAQFIGDFIQLVRIAGGTLTEVWDYKWDQRKVAEFTAIPWTPRS